MAINKFGPQGFLSGKLGDLVYYVRNGKQMVRKRTRMTKPPTEAQLRSRKQLTVVVGFLKPLLSVVNVGFLPAAKGQRTLPYSLAVKYNRIHAVSGSYPDVVMDYAKVLLTMQNGGVAAAAQAVVAQAPEGLKFEWQAGDEGGWSAANDQVMLFVYFPELRSVAYRLYGSCRSACTDFLPLTSAQLGERMEVFISFVSADRNGMANSTYLGRLN